MGPLPVCKLDGRFVLSWRTLVEVTLEYSFVHPSLHPTNTHGQLRGSPQAPNSAESGYCPRGACSLVGKLGMETVTPGVRPVLERQVPHWMRPQCLGASGLSPVGLALGPGGGLAFADRKWEGERRPRQRGQHKQRWQVGRSWIPGGLWF